jgi:hypothetical protein
MLRNSSGEHMAEKFGFEIKEWNEVKEEMRQALTKRTKVQGTIPYSTLVDQVTTISLEPGSSA